MASLSRDLSGPWPSEFGHHSVLNRSKALENVGVQWLLLYRVWRARTSRIPRLVTSETEPYFFLFYELTRLPMRASHRENDFSPLRSREKLPGPKPNQPQTTQHAVNDYIK